MDSYFVHSYFLLCRMVFIPSRDFIEQSTFLIIMVFFNLKEKRTFRGCSLISSYNLTANRIKSGIQGPFIIEATKTIDVPYWGFCLVPSNIDWYIFVNVIVWNSHTLNTVLTSKHNYRRCTTVPRSSLGPTVFSFTSCKHLTKRKSALL